MLAHFTLSWALLALSLGGGCIGASSKALREDKSIDSSLGRAWLSAVASSDADFLMEHSTIPFPIVYRGEVARRGWREPVLLREPRTFAHDLIQSLDEPFRDDRGSHLAEIRSARYRSAEPEDAAHSLAFRWNEVRGLVQQDGGELAPTGEWLSYSEIILLGCGAKVCGIVRTEYELEDTCH